MAPTPSTSDEPATLQLVRESGLFVAARGALGRSEFASAPIIVLAALVPLRFVLVTTSGPSRSSA